ncbi:hypothetical protein ACVDG8_001735 [Mesorhizobium sp. ORM8.1]
MTLTDIIDTMDRARLPAVLTYPGSAHEWSVTVDNKDWLELFRTNEAHLRDGWTNAHPGRNGPRRLACGVSMSVY